MQRSERLPLLVRSWDLSPGLPHTCCPPNRPRRSRATDLLGDPPPVRPGDSPDEDRLSGAFSRLIRDVRSRVVVIEDTVAIVITLPPGPPCLHLALDPGLPALFQTSAATRTAAFRLLKFPALTGWLPEQAVIFALPAPLDLRPDSCDPSR